MQPACAIRFLHFLIVNELSVVMPYTSLQKKQLLAFQLIIHKFGLKLSLCLIDTSFKTSESEITIGDIPFRGFEEDPEE